MQLDPLHDPRVQIRDQERNQREEKGLYKAPPFLIWAVCTLIVLMIAAAIVFYALH